MGIIISAKNNQEFPSTVSIKSDVAHNAYHMADDPRYYEPMRGNTFEFIVTGLDNLVKAGMSADEENSRIGGGDAKKAQEALRLSVNAASVPSFSQDTIEVKRGNSSVKFAGLPSFDSGSITINDFIGLEAREALYAWQALSYNVLTQKVGVGQDYKKTCYLQEFTPDWQLVRTWILKGCWIQSISDNGFSSDNGGMRTVTATIVYDMGMIDRSDEIT